jgi:hypothetical protein
MERVWGAGERRESTFRTEPRQLESIDFVQYGEQAA